MRRFFLILSCLIASWATTAAARADYSCDDAKANRAAKIIYRLDDWHQMYEFFSVYGSCDVYTVAEGSSDRVSDLVANKWDTFDDLAAQIRLHPPFYEFVVSHIDRMAPENRLQQIYDNATKRCPTDDADICARVAAKVRRLLPQTEAP